MSTKVVDFLLKNLCWSLLFQGQSLLFSGYQIAFVLTGMSQAFLKIYNVKYFFYKMSKTNIFTWGMLGYFLSFSTNDIYYYF